MSRETIKLKLELIKAKAALLADSNWWADDLQRGVSEIVKLANEISQDARKFESGDR